MKECTSLCIACAIYKYCSEKKSKVQHIYTYFNTNEKRNRQKDEEEKKKRKKKKNEIANVFLDDVAC